MKKDEIEPFLEIISDRDAQIERLNIEISEWNSKWQQESMRIVFIKCYASHFGSKNLKKLLIHHMDKVIEEGRKQYYSGDGKMIAKEKTR